MYHIIESIPSNTDLFDINTNKQTSSLLNCQPFNFARQDRSIIVLLIWLMCLLKHIITEFFLPFHPKTVNVLWKKANHRSHPEVAAALFVHNEGYFGVWCILVTVHLLPFRQQETRPEHSGFTLVLLCLPACHYTNTAHTSRVEQFTSIRGWFVVSVVYQCCCRKTQGVFTCFFLTWVS